MPFLDIDPTFIDLEISGIQHTLEQLKITRKKRRSRVNYLDKEFRRIENLFRRGSSPESRLDTSREDVDQARLDLQAIGIEIAIAQTRLIELRERKSRHTIHAPPGWIVVADWSKRPNLYPSILRLHNRRFRAPRSSAVVSAQELAAIQKLPPEFDVLFDGNSAKAAFNWINPEFDEKTRKLSIELILRSYPGPKRGGLICQLALQIYTEGLWVPKRAVISRYGNPRVFLKESGAGVKVLELGQTEEHLVIADDPRLPPGTLLRNPTAFQLRLDREP